MSRSYENREKIIMNKSNRKLGLFVLVMFVISICLSGCKLANEELQDIKNGDKLIGVFITYEEDLKDYTMQEGDTLHYDEKKLERADGSIKELTDEEFESFKAFSGGFTVEGTKKEDDTYKFENIEGYYMGYTEEMVNEDGETYPCTSSHYSDGVYDINVGISSHSIEDSSSAKGLFGKGLFGLDGVNEIDDIDVEDLKEIENLDESDDNKIKNFDDNEEVDNTDEENEQEYIFEPTFIENAITIEGTIGVSSDKKSELRLNKVYQRDDGSVYAIIPSSACIMIDTDYGGNQGLSISESYQSNIKGTGISKQSPKKTSTFKVNVEQIDFLESALVRQMDKNHKPVKLTEVDLTNNEQEFKLNQNTDYVIIEEHLIDRKGRPYNKRTAYDCMQIGQTWDNGYEEWVSHTFHITDENGKIGLVNLSFKR